MNRPTTSKNRFAEFLQKFRRGEFKQIRLDDETSGDDEKRESAGDESKKNGKKRLTPEQRKKRRGYLRLYINRLKVHWVLVALLISFAMGVALLDMIQPLFMRYIIDDILLADGTRRKTEAAARGRDHVHPGGRRQSNYGRVSILVPATFECPRDFDVAASVVRKAVAVTAGETFRNENRRHHFAIDRRYQYHDWLVANGRYFAGCRVCSFVDCDRDFIRD